MGPYQELCVWVVVAECPWRVTPEQVDEPAHAQSEVGDQVGSMKIFVNVVPHIVLNFTFLLFLLVVHDLVVPHGVEDLVLVHVASVLVVVAVGQLPGVVGDLES